MFNPTRLELVSIINVFSLNFMTVLLAYLLTCIISSLSNFTFLPHLSLHFLYMYSLSTFHYFLSYLLASLNFFTFFFYLLSLFSHCTIFFVLCLISTLLCHPTSLSIISLYFLTPFFVTLSQFVTIFSLHSPSTFASTIFFLSTFSLCYILSKFICQLLQPI